MAATMLSEMRSGIEADYVIADAWFGTKSMMRTALGLESVRDLTYEEEQDEISRHHQRA